VERALPGGCCWSFGVVRVVCMRDIFISNKIGMKDEIFRLVLCLVEIFYLSLSTGTAMNYKQHIL
jgi:hypothetical protein